MTKKVLLLMAVIAVAVSVAAQQGRQRRYDPATETTVTGTVEDVMQITHPGRGGSGTHLRLKTETGVIEVHVGPTWYLESQKASFAKGDAVTVTGSKVGGAVIAREVKKGDAVLTLRDKQGVPKWSRGGRPS